ncbi:MAG: alpha/beta hydrolase [Casimicrobiaceae bacterium]|nr:alpha/beta hydrolase [Casimicrobiaceae bacterium]MCX8099021.1 alpha/beta hydrolase [Casimicrobiaceae bacterium]MDW8312917.1 alpha/beta hydrolase [Burkholderiales bacterium]
MQLAFAHANGFPPGVYRQFLSALEGALDGASLVAPLLESPASTPAHERWSKLARQFAAVAHKQAAGALIGHSMGGYLALEAACAVSGVRQVILIDAPIPVGWRGALLTVAKATGLSYRFGPAPVAARRRDQWPTREAARTHFASKPFVQRWAPGVLEDFLDHALVPHPEGGLTLAIARAIECDLYAHLPHERARRALESLRGRGVLVQFVAGVDSDEVRLAGRRSNQLLFAPHWHVLPAGHLVPLELPQACAQLVAQLLKPPRA